MTIIKCFHMKSHFKYHDHNIIIKSPTLHWPQGWGRLKPQWTKQQSVIVLMSFGDVIYINCQFSIFFLFFSFILLCCLLSYAKMCKEWLFVIVQQLKVLNAIFGFIETFRQNYSSSSNAASATITLPDNNSTTVTCSALGPEFIVFFRLETVSSSSSRHQHKCQQP